MPKATEEQRAAFASALRNAMRSANPLVATGARPDEWLGAQIGLSGQAIRNYLAGIREPKNDGVVAAIEDALQVERHSLGQFLGYGPSVTEQLDALREQVDRLQAALDAALAPPQRRSPRASKPKRSAP